MASELRVNTLKDAAGNNSIATSFVAGGSAKAYGNVTQISTTSYAGSFNCSSISDSGTGNFVTTRTTNMGNANYSTTGAVMANRAGGMTANLGDTYTTSQTEFVTCDTRSVALTDYDKSCFQISGDLA